MLSFQLIKIEWKAEIIIKINKHKKQSESKKISVSINVGLKRLINALQIEAD